MSAADVFLLVIRWLHLVSAAAWMGGSLFYLLVLRPALRRAPQAQGAVNEAAATEFRVLVDTSIFVLVTTGVILSFDRLTPGVVGVPYVATLAVKIALSIWMFVLARSRRSPIRLTNSNAGAPQTRTGLQRVLRSVSGYNTIVIFGIIVFLLSDLLQALFEMDLPGN